MFALFCIPWAANAQETLTVHDGTTTNSNVPIWGLWADNSLQSEMVYPATELEDMNGGTISILNVFSNGTSNIPSTGTSSCWNGTCQIFMKEVPETTISDFTGTDGATIVYDGPISLVNGVMTIELSTPYTYGGGNLLVGFYYTSGGAYASVTWKGESVTNAAVYGRSGQSYSANAASFLPKTTFTYEVASTGCDYMPISIAVSDITTDGATVTWEGDGDTWNLRYKASTDEEFTLVEGLRSQTYTFEGTLAGNTTYNVGVQADCGNATSNFKSTSFTTANACAAPTNLLITDVTPSSATLSWTAGYRETEWTVKYKKSSDTEYTEETVSGDPTLTLRDLEGLTTYNVQVYNCENYVSGTFTTAAGIPFVEAFNASSKPTGWSMYTGLLSNVMSGTALTSATYGWSFGTGNGVFDSHVRVNIYGNSCNKWLVLPTLVMEDNVQLTFDIALTKFSGDLQAIDNTLGEDDRFVVLITTDGGTTWSILREWNNTGSDDVYNNIACSAIGESVAINLSDYAGQDIAVAFYGESTVAETGSDNYLHIDNVSIDYIPSCAKPTGLAKSDVTAHEATITWTSDAAAWQVQLNEEDPIDVTEATYTFTGLNPETAYTAKVRANCSGTYSDWTNSVSFTTTIACPAPTNLTVTPNALTATFTWESNAGEWEVAYATDNTADPAENIVGTVNEATYTVNDLELGDYYFWVRANCGELDGNSQWAGPASVHIGYCVPNPSGRDGKGITKVIFGTGDYLVNNVDETNGLPASSPFYGDYTSMVGAMQAGVESTVSITYATGSSTVYSYGTIIWVDWDNSLTFEDSEIVYTGTSNQGSGGVPQVLDATVIVPANQATGEYRMRIAGADSYFDSYIGGTATGNHSACFSSSYAVCHDYTLRVLEAPSCLTPTGLAASNVTAHEATITWTSDAAAWQVQLNEEDEDPIDVEETTYTFENLAPETTYTAKVRTNCNGTYSEWTNLVTFTTTIACPAPTALTVTPNVQSATFTWESNAGEWEVAYATDNTADPAENIAGTANEATYTVNDLELGDYYFWVRANCGELDGNSTWAGPASVHIGYCVPAPTSVDNNGISNVTFGMGDYIVNNETPKATYTDYTSQIGAVQAGVETTIAITFKTSYSYNTYVWVDLDNSLSFDADEVVCYGESSDSNPTTLTLNFTIPADQTSGDFRLRIGSADSGLGSDPDNANPCYTSSYACFQDYTLRVLEAPSCLTPTGLAVNYTGGNTAEVTWEGEAETYNLYVNQEVYDSITSPYTLESLELATIYTLQIEANCDNETSELSNPVSFTTDLCMPEEMCEISYSFTDQYDDSWNNAYMNIVDATTGVVLYELTMPSVQGPYEGSFNVCDGRDIQFVWVSGNYPRECGYTFTHKGETILEKATGATAPSAGVVLTYTVDCSCFKILVDADNPTWSEDFEGYDVTTTLPERWTGVLPTCWTVPVQYTGTTDTLPQVYQGFNTTDEGLYSLRMHFRYMLAMPELDENVDLGKLRMNLNVRQPYYAYKLQIGIITDMDNPETSFVPVAVVNNSGKNMTNFECGFTSVSDLVGAGRHIAFKNIGGSTNDLYCTNYLDDITLTYVNVDDLECEIYPDYTEDFEAYEVSAEPNCWEVITEDAALESTTRPQVYAGFNTTPSGSKSLRMKNRCVYAMPELLDYPISNFTMTFNLRQPKSIYRLQVGVVDEEGNFQALKTFKCPNTTDFEEMSVNFANFDLTGNRIAFRNTLVPGTGKRTDYLDYSINYIDDINFTYEARGRNESNAGAFEAEGSLEDIAVYPNPTTGNLYIDAIGIQKVECYNQMGQLVRVYDNVRNSIDLNNLSEGVYTLRITVPQGVTMRKVVKR